VIFGAFWEGTMMLNKISYRELEKKFMVLEARCQQEENVFKAEMEILKAENQILRDLLEKHGISYQNEIESNLAFEGWMNR